MELRARISPFARRAAFTAALGALLVPAAAGTATADAAKRKKKRFPVVTSVRPLEAAVGDTMTIRGRNFKRGRNKNTVVFKRDGGRALFVKADVGTTRLLSLKLPKRLEAALAVEAGVRVPSRLRVRVLAERLSRKYTRVAGSPTISPERIPASAAPGSNGSSSSPAVGPSGQPVAPPVDPDGDCDADGVLNRVDADDDADLLPDSLETSLGLDGCNADSDRDGAGDAYEHRSAQDLNDDEHQDANGFLPHPDKRPYPNALDDDAGVDHDGDTLTLLEEYRLWIYTLGGRRPAADDLTRLTYSAGEQYSISRRDVDGRRKPDLAAAGYAKQADFLGWAAAAGYDQVALSDVADEWYEARTTYDIRDFNRSGGAAGTVPAGGAYAPEVTYYDFNDDGWLTDAERDEDADGLTNFDETRGCTTRSYWDALYDKETPYYIKDFASTRHDDPDTDGDGVRDGADDQDHDDVPNVMECSRTMASGDFEDPRPALADPPPHPAVSFVNPFNPCVPHRASRTCNRFPTLSSPWAPFNPDDKYFYVWN